MKFSFFRSAGAPFYLIHARAGQVKKGEKIKAAKERLKTSFIEAAWK